MSRMTAGNRVAGCSRLCGEVDQGAVERNTECPTYNYPLPRSSSSSFLRGPTATSPWKCTSRTAPTCPMRSPLLLLSSRLIRHFVVIRRVVLQQGSHVQRTSARLNFEKTDRCSDTEAEKETYLEGERGEKEGGARAGLFHELLLLLLLLSPCRGNAASRGGCVQKREPEAGCHTPR